MFPNVVKNRIKKSEFNSQVFILKEFLFTNILMLYQAYGCKERKKHRFTNQTTRRQVKNLTSALTKRNKKMFK